MALSWPLDLIQLHSFPLLDGGRPLIQPVCVREVAHCFVRALSTEAAIGRTFDLVGPVSFSWREMVLKIVAVLCKTAIYEEIPLLLFLRALLWLAAVLTPIMIIIGVAAGIVSLAEAEIGAVFAVALLVTAFRWRETILFNVPGEPLRMAGEVLSTIAPRELQFSEQLKMAGEDNIGDPGPASEAFSYTPETFEQGLARILGAKGATK